MLQSLRRMARGSRPVSITPRRLYFMQPLRCGFATLQRRYAYEPTVRPQAAPAVGAQTAGSGGAKASAASVTAAAASEVGAADVVAPPAHWRVASVDPMILGAAASSLGVHPALAAVILNRNTPDPVAAASDPARLKSKYLETDRSKLHSPFEFNGMRAAVKRIERAIESGERVVIHGDYDVDGVTGTAILTQTLKLLKSNVEWFIPNRLLDGYSFGEHSIQKVKASGATVVISVDSGTASTDTISKLKELGVDTIVTDHHEPPTGAELPPAVAIINPKVPGTQNLHLTYSSLMFSALILSFDRTPHSHSQVRRIRSANYVEVRWHLN